MSGPLLVVRADGNGRIGSGHIARCAAVARAATSMGGRVVFAVSDMESGEMAAGRNIEFEVVGGDAMALSAEDGEALSGMAARLGAAAVLIDSYAVTEEFFRGVSSGDVAIAYIDDAYTYAIGVCGNPVAWPVDLVVSYGFGSDVATYERVYQGRANVLVGPRFAPVRDEFRGLRYACRRRADRVLVTSGATNHGRALESMAEACALALPRARINVAVGPFASFEPGAVGANLVLHEGVSDLSGLMRESDVAVAAAGSTLYELACVGVPTVAVAVSADQLDNARGFSREGLGVSFDAVAHGWDIAALSASVAALADRYGERSRLSSACRGLVDGDGGRRICEALFGLAANGELSWAEESRGSCPTPAARGRLGMEGRGPTVGGNAK